MNMPDWIDEFKSSVSWGDQIEPYQEREFDFPVLTVVLEHGGGTSGLKQICRNYQAFHVK